MVTQIFVASKPHSEEQSFSGEGRSVSTERPWRDGNPVLSSRWFVRCSPLPRGSSCGFKAERS